MANIQAPKNGYAYVYISNETNLTVYFDNLKVALNRGRIMEEDHYYPFGLRMAGISSEKLADTSEGTVKNNYLYNDKELFDDAGLDWYDYGFRNYDPQIGRFPQLDPLTDDYPELTPFQYASDDPVANVDVDGLEGVPVLSSLPKTANGVFIANSFSEVVVSAAKPTTAVSVGKAFFKGFGKDLWGAVRGTAHALIHIDQTLKGLAQLQQPGPGSLMAGMAAYQKGAQTVQEFRYGNAETRAGIIGAGAGEIIQLFGGEISEIGKTGEIGKLTEAAGDAGKIAEEVDKTGVAAKTTGAGSQYSVAYEMKLANSSYPGIYRSTHFLEANKSLNATMVSDERFASTMSELGVNIPRSPAGSILGRSPANWVWHHDVNAGVMQLVPKYQHTVGSSFWSTLHPGGIGGFSIWGK